MKQQQPIENIITITYQPPNQQTWFYKTLYGENTDAQLYETIQQLQRKHTLLTDDLYARITEQRKAAWWKVIQNKHLRIHIQTTYTPPNHNPVNKYPFTHVQLTDNPKDTCPILTLGWSRHQYLEAIHSITMNDTQPLHALMCYFIDTYTKPSLRKEAHQAWYYIYQKRDTYTKKE